MKTRKDVYDRKNMGCAECARNQKTFCDCPDSGWNNHKPQHPVSASEHTPTPIDIVISCSATGNLTTGGLLRYIESEHVDKDAKVTLGEYLVRAVNSHEDYKEVAMYARALLKALEPRFMRTGCSDTEQVALKCLREAITKAEGR